MIRTTAHITNSLDLGPKSGPKVLVKECIGVQGLPTRCGSAAFENAPLEVEHAAVVQRLIAAGAHITGTTTMHELAFGVTGANAYAGTATNPLWPDRIPGGSSSGSAAAVAAGLCDFAIGTDTGGSIRQPACCCGIYGLKPTQDAISRRGAIPRASSLDVIGPFAASAEMLTRAAGMLLDGFAPVQIDAPKLGRTPVQVDADIIAAVDGVLSPRWETVTPLDGLEAAFKAGITLINYELAGEFGHLARSNATLGAEVRARLLNALTVTPEMAAEAELVRTQFTEEVDNALTGLDALVLPTMPCVPPTWDQAQNPATIIPLTKLVRPFNLSGHPALTVPLRTAAGLPAGLQLVGRKGEEARLCAIAEFLERQLTTEPFVEMIG